MMNVMRHGASGDTVPGKRSDFAFLTKNMEKYAKAGGVLFIHDYMRRDALSQSLSTFHVKTVIRLCLNDLDSARARKEEAKGDRLPEPVKLEDSGLTRVVALDRISMAFIVLLQRLTPAERAVLLLHEVCDFRARGDR